MSSVHYETWSDKDILLETQVFMMSVNADEMLPLVIPHLESRGLVDKEGNWTQKAKEIMGWNN